MRGRSSPTIYIQETTKMFRNPACADERERADMCSTTNFDVRNARTTTSCLVHAMPVWGNDCPWLLLAAVRGQRLEDDRLSGLTLFVHDKAKKREPTVRQLHYVSLRCTSIVSSTEATTTQAPATDVSYGQKIEKILSLRIVGERTPNNFRPYERAFLWETFFRTDANWQLRCVSAQRSFPTTNKTTLFDNLHQPNP